uniref:Rhodanese domain-containing protein n=1 Tax=Ditylum brightwellii TaxID=49249 RepID=A0A6U3RX31_9STRA|mmetsp:Transcript_2488/g.3323  ORF Transcript_2488/g.3323 Transcript_2488/m.3323 type:complete len:179 (-) Transcript_2488:399-935(-)
MTNSSSTARDEATAFFDTRCRPNLDGVMHVNAEYVNKRYREDNVLLVDVRSAAEQKISMIPGSITKEQLQTMVQEGGKLRKIGSNIDVDEVIAYCGIGGRSGSFIKNEFNGEEGAFASLLTEGKIAKVLNFELSMIGWCWADGELADAAGPTKNVHGCGEMFASMYPQDGRYNVVLEE